MALSFLNEWLSRALCVVSSRVWGGSPAGSVVSWARGPVGRRISGSPAGPVAPWARGPVGPCLVGRWAQDDDYGGVRNIHGEEMVEEA